MADPITLMAVSLGSQAIGIGQQYRASKNAAAEAKAQADYEKANTQARVSEERSRNSQNLLRAQEQKRKQISAQRASYVKAGILPDSQSADMVIGELGENLQTRIQDMFVQGQDKVRGIQSQGDARYFSALNQAKASKRQATGALISGLGSMASQGVRANGEFGFFGKGKK